MRKLPDSSMSCFIHVEKLRRFGLLLIVGGLMSIPATAQVGLPRSAVSIAVGSLPAESCEGVGKLIVLPPVQLNLAEEQDNAEQFAGISQILQNLPEGTEAWLHVKVSAGGLTGQETERQINDRVDAFLAHAPLTEHAVRGLIVESDELSLVTDQFAFGLVRLGIGAKSTQRVVRLAYVFGPGFVDRHGAIVSKLALYADLLGTTYTDSWQKDAAWIAEHALNRPLILKVNGDAASATAAYLGAELAASGSSAEMLWSEPADRSAAERVCTINSFMAHAIGRGMVRLDSGVAPLTLTAEGMTGDETQSFGSGQSQNVVMVAHVHAGAGHPKSVTLEGTTPFDIQWYDPADGARLPVGERVKTAKGWQQTVLCSSEYVLITLHGEGSDAAVYNAVNIKTAFDLSVGEVVARWQQYRGAQKQRLENYQASSFMNLHFENTNLVSAFDISMGLKQFYKRAGAMEFAQKTFYVNGVKFSNKHAFPLPQLEPEKVLTQPLELKLSEHYTYTLEGMERLNGAACYVVAVQPGVQDETLYSGRIWIDATTFREVKQTLSQRGIKSNIVVNVETQNFELVPDGRGNQFNLLQSISAQQTLNAAGRDFLLQRTIQFSEYSINNPQFDDALAVEHSTDDPMYRDTDQGLRELRKQHGERVLQQSSETRIRSLVSGAMYEGTYNFPIPFLGISIADFDYRHTGAQLSTFFAGPILVTDLSKQYGNKYRLSGDLALSALPGENRVYAANIENTSEAVWSWEEDTGLRATWQATTHFSTTASTYLSYLFYRATSDTSSQYVLPRNGVSLLPGLQIKYTNKGYEFTANGTWGQRIAWRQFGYAAQTAPQESGYLLYDADINKNYYFRKFTKAGWDFSYYGGNQLDRFSRYFPSFFSEPRLHGIPSGTDTFDAIAMGNVHYGFNAMDLIKIEGLYSYARARNLAESSHYRLFDGLETNFNTVGPFGTLIQGTVSYALDGNITRYNSRWGLTVMIFKPLPW